MSVFFLLPEKSPVYLHGFVSVMGAVCAPGDSSICFHESGGVELPGRPLLLFHHTHHSRFWRLCGRLVELYIEGNVYLRSPKVLKITVKNS